jgi:hypothetical protein
MGQNYIIKKGLGDFAIGLKAKGLSPKRISERLTDHCGEIICEKSVSNFFKERSENNTRAILSNPELNDKLAEQDIEMLKTLKERLNVQMFAQSERVGAELARAYERGDRRMIQFYENLVQRLNGDFKGCVEMYDKFRNGLIINHNISGNLDVSFKEQVQRWLSDED